MTDNLDSEILNWILVAKGMDESLADILRHDQDHDNWHAMHGDPPCKSEADCARMRAKYSEVKAENGVQKGDLPGHVFHGNQYQDLSRQAAWLAWKAQVSSPKDAYSLHQKARDAHLAAIEGIRSGLPQKQVLHVNDLENVLSRGEAIKAHEVAADAHQEAMLKAQAAILADPSLSAPERVAFEAAANSASDKSVKADKATRKIPNYSGEVQKGDTPGHPFRGNQYGSSEMTARADQVNQNAYQLGKNGSSPDDHQALADEHHAIADLHQERADSLREAAKDWAASGYKKDATEMEQAAAAHIEAAKAHDDASIAHEAAGRNVSPETVSAAQSAAETALDKSLTADKITSQHGLYLNTPDITKAVNYPDARIPGNMTANSGFSVASDALLAGARAIIAAHEAVATGGASTFTSDDYDLLAAQHESLAKAHREIAEALKFANPVVYIQAISAHGDAMGAHEDAARTAQMMTNSVYDAHWDGHHGEIRPAAWNSENKVWRKAHRAFLMSQQAFNRTNFATGTVL